MAVSRSPAGTVRTRPASVDSRGRERESRGAATKGARQKKADGRLWCGCISRPFALSSPSFGKRSSANAKSDSKSSSKGVNGREAGVKASLDCRPGESNLMKSNDRSTISENVACRTTLLGGETTASNSNKATPGVMVEVKAGDSLIARKFSSLAEGLELRPISPFRPRLSPGKVSPLLDQQQQQSVAGDSGGNSPTVMPQPPCTSYSKLGSTNSSLGSSPPVDRAKSSPSPTLFEMMAHEQDVAAAKPFLVNAASQNSSLDLSSVPLSTSTMQPSLHDKVRGILGGSSPGNQFNDSSSSDLKLTLSSRDGYSVTVSVHRHILVSNSRFFAAKLSDRWSKQQRSLPHLVEISDCDDVELYLETLRLMYCCDLKRTLMKETVVRVLGILKVSAAIVFEAGVASCLEFLEAVPWDQEEEEKINVVLSQLQLETFGANEVLKRCAAVEASNSEDILVRLLNSVTQGTDEKARREMKALVSRMLRENVSQNKVHFDLSKESLYKVCHRCMDAILHLYMQATSTDFVSKNSEDRVSLFSQIARQADNLHWLVDILIDRRIADDLVRLWAHQSELATLHMQVPTMYRYEVSRLTARFCIAIGKGQVVSPKDVRYMLLQTWLQPLVEDFGWIQRCCKVLDKKVVEEGISQTILTLPLKQQQTILLAWFDRFSNSGDDCPNLQKAFEVWWRRIFLKPTSFDEDGLVLEPQIP